MQFFGALDNTGSMPNRSNINPRTDDRSKRTCRTIGSFAVYMHDFGLDKFDSRFRDDASCWNVTAFNTSTSLEGNCSQPVDRHYTWWCNKRPNNPCVFNCPNQASASASSGLEHAQSVTVPAAGPFEPNTKMVMLCVVNVASWADLRSLHVLH